MTRSSDDKSASRDERLVDALTNLHGRFQRLILGLFLVLAVVAAASLSGLRMESGFTRSLPQGHPYVETYFEHQQRFGGGNRVLVVLRAPEASVFTAKAFADLKAVTDVVLALEGVSPASVRSLFTPNVRYLEVRGDALVAEDVVPQGFSGSDSELREVRRRVMLSGEIGRLIASDFSAFAVSAELLERHPDNAEPIDHAAVGRALESALSALQTGSDGRELIILGFAPLQAAIEHGMWSSWPYTALAIGLVILVLWVWSRDPRFALLPVLVALLAVLLQLGSAVWLGLRLDPFTVLMPVLIFAIGVSHALQFVVAMRVQYPGRAQAVEGSRAVLRQLLRPALIALLSDAMGFAAVSLIDVPLLRDAALLACLGIAWVLLCNLLVLPALIARFGVAPSRGGNTGGESSSLVGRLRGRAHPGGFLLLMLIATGLLVVMLGPGGDSAVGDIQPGVPELSSDHPYNRGLGFVSERFRESGDRLTVLLEGPVDACVSYRHLQAVDSLAWQLRQLSGVNEVLALPGFVRLMQSAWNEGHPKWQALPRDPRLLGQYIQPFESHQLMNADCTLMVVHVFVTDHRAVTIQSLLQAIDVWEHGEENPEMRVHVGTGNLPLLAARNDVVADSWAPALGAMLMMVVLLCLLSFRRRGAVLVIALPLMLAMIWAWALMGLLQIGLKINTLPVLLLGMGIGVNFAIYLYARVQERLDGRDSVTPAIAHAFRTAGPAVVITGLTLALATGSWWFSALKFQSDVGLLLSFLFLANMIAAVIVVPALVEITTRWREHPGDR